MNTTPCNISIQNDIYPRLNEECEKRKISKSRFINIVLHDWFSTKDNINNSMPELLKGMEDIKIALQKGGFEFPSELDASAGSVNGVSEPQSDKKRA